MEPPSEIDAALYELKPAPGFPGVHTSPVLRRHLLGLVPSHKLFYCLSCPKGRPLKVSTAAAHLKTAHEHRVSKLPSIVKKLASHYNVYSGLLSEFPRPSLVVHPLPFLPTVLAHRCLLCLGLGVSWLGIDETTRINHFSLHHGPERSLRTSYEKPCLAQSFAVPHSGHTLFEVNKDVPPTIPQEEEDLYEVHGSTPERLVRCFLGDYAPVRLQRPTDVKLKDVSPFLVHTGWVKHVQPFDPSFLVSLTEAPAKDAHLWRLYDAAVRVFKTEQKIYPKVLPLWSTALMDDGSGAPTRPFRALQSDSAVAEYAKTLGLWSCFIVRLYELHQSGDPRYPVSFTREQLAAAKQALRYTREIDASTSAVRVISDLARWFWRAEHPEYFAHMALSQFNDPTVRFAALINLREDGSFLDPRNSTHNLVQIKYAVRAGLYLWSRLEAEENGASVVGMIDRIRGSLVKVAITPFACVADATSTGTTYAASSVRLPNVMWTSSADLMVEGQMISWPRLREEINALMAEVRQHILRKVLLGISLSDLEYEIDERTAIRDDPSRLDQGYSFLDDLDGPFVHLKTRLGSKFLSDPRGAHLHRGVDESNKIVWVDDAVHAWMKDCEWAMEKLALLMHVSGGQPGRGVEFCNVQVKNPLHRFWGVYVLGPGRVIVVLAYNKTTTNTGRDWIVAHAVPWCVGELFLIMHGLVNPLVGILVARTYGEEKRQVQEGSAFGSFGKQLSSERLAAIIEAWSRARFQVDIRIRRLRHLIIAVQHHLMPEACSPFKKSLLILDAQAGHTTETGQAHYAIDASETHRLATNTVAKEIAASARWWSVLIDRANLTPAELAEGQRAAVTIAREEVLPLPPAASVEPAAIREAFAACAPDITATLLQQLVEKLPALLPAVDLGCARPIAPDGFQPAPGVVVEMAHVDALQRFRNDTRATFRSHGQAQAFVHVLKRSASVLCVLATGGGKSLLFASMPVVERGITVVVFPLRAVLMDQVQSSRRVDHLPPFKIWQYGEHFEDGVVALSVEAAATPGFGVWLTGLNGQKRLNRIVFDEAHMLVTEGSYRLVMGQVKTLVEQGVPLVCLTATLPPSMMPDLRNVLGFPTFHVVRESTLRRNIVLRTALFATRAHALSALVRHVVKFRTELKPGEGIMVQCRFRAETERIAGMLTKATGVDTNFYHGGVNEWEKDEVAFRWIAGRDAVIVCTSGLGSGVNHPSCRAVLHFGPPYGATDYAQEVGRSGRDGLPSLAILFAWQPLPPVDHPDVKGYSYLREAIETGDCIQYRLTRFLDGADLAATCASSGCLPCGPCKNDLAKAALRLAPALRNGSMGPSLELVVRSEQDWIERHLPTVQTGQTSSATPTHRHPQYPQAKATVLVPGTPSPHASPVRAGPASPSSGPPSLGPAPRGAPPDTSSSSSRAEIQSGDRREPSVGQTPRHPPADVGAQVRADAQNSKNRRQPGPHAAHEQNEDQEERHAPYSLPTLLRIKARYSECCPLCTLDRRAHRDHRLQDCPHWPGTKGTLEGMDIEGKAFSPCKRSSRLPGPNQLCFYCWWPLPSRHGHPNAPAPQGCSVPDNIPQLCWMAFRDPETRAELQAGLSVDASHFSSIDRYWAWIYASRRKVTYRGQTTTFLNAHAVYIYFHGVDF